VAMTAPLFTPGHCITEAKFEIRISKSETNEGRVSVSGVLVSGFGFQISGASGGLKPEL